MNYASIKKRDIANGKGVRVSLFVSGCTHHCPDCFNSETWDFNYGKPFTDDTINEILLALGPDYIEGLSLLGGEPFEPQNQAGLLQLVRKFKSEYPNKNIWCYTGYLFENILNGKVGDKPTANELLSYIDILVDGRFVKDLKNLSLKFKGSSNQRIIDVKKSLDLGEVVLSQIDLENNEILNRRMKNEN